VPFYCAQDDEKIRSVYGAVLSKFTVKIRIAESIDLGRLTRYELTHPRMQETEHENRTERREENAMDEQRKTDNDN
jgi:hypothetical protein